LNVKTSIRRIVTALDETGRSRVLTDETNPNYKKHPVSGIEACVLWTTNAYPPSVAAQSDPVTGKEGIAPARDGSIFHIVDFPPLKTEALAAGYVQSMVDPGIKNPVALSTHPMVHRTDTLDYALIMSGEIDMVVGEELVHCKAGDVVIQQATVHGWLNHSAENCRVAFVMLDAGPQQ
jgi:mannose-6-phosphate isomerase-like protein (cupin superfamily)